ncbi:MAG: CDP-alcohol phosphatidyltransferase family protein [Candidatus Methanospirare jalkutatii]|nr:CDP-alcohol phosphatidyltransferase family protein [Candidatus Methanospirare jalkutatii]
MWKERGWEHQRVGEVSQKNVEESIFKMLELPDILSVLNALLGFSAILLVAFRAGSAEWQQGATASLKEASLLILIAAAVDGFDGLIARRFSRSNLGKYLDALADFLSFGAATAVLLYFFVFSALSNTTVNNTTADIAHAILTLNAAICGAYVASGMLRLARFLNEVPNAAEEVSERAEVMSQKLQKLQKSQSKNEYFVGFPITGSAVLIASFILSSPLLSSRCGCCTTTASSTTASYFSFAAVIPLLLLATLLSILMPSRVRYKKIRHRSLAFVLAFSLVLVLILRFLADSLLAYPALVVFALSFAYLVSPLFRRHPFR